MWKRSVFVFLLTCCLCVIPSLPVETEGEEELGGGEDKIYLNSFVIEVEKRDIAEEVARTHGFIVKDEIPSLNAYHLIHEEVSPRSKRSAEHHINKLKSDSRVQHVEQQEALIRVKRTHVVLHDKQIELNIDDVEDNSLFYRVEEPLIGQRDKLTATLPCSDPYSKDQWYLNNNGQTGGKRSTDMNVLAAWKSGVTGKGVVVTVLDDGIDHNHPDLKRNYDPKASKDLNGEDADPMPNKKDISNSHGTRCAGEIAAECGNNFCGAGIAFDAKVGGVRMLDGTITDFLESQAILFNNQYVDIYSASWGPRDDGRTMEAPKKYCSAALEKGAKEGRKGLGSIFVWATGNGGDNGDSCACDGYVSSPYSISVGSLSDHGEKPYFMESCSSTMIVVPTGGESSREEELKARYKIKVVTTDLGTKCIENFEGTSSAAPLAAGALALVLQKNPRLTWRDVQHIAVLGAKVSTEKGTWTVNGAGKHVSHDFGFGMMDCSEMVQLAENWQNVPSQLTWKSPEQDAGGVQVPANQCVKKSLDVGESDTNINTMEHVQIYIKARATRRGTVQIWLTSPHGTESLMLPNRERDISTEGINFTFLTVHNWLEDPVGTWTVRMCHNAASSGGTDQVTWDKWSLTIYGYQNTSVGKSEGQAHKATDKELKDVMQREMERSKRVQIKRMEENEGDGSLENTGESAGKNGQSAVEEMDTEFKKRYGKLFDDLSQILKERGMSADDLLQSVEGGKQDFGNKRGQSGSHTHLNRGYSGSDINEIRGNLGADKDYSKREPPKEEVSILDEKREHDLPENAYLNTHKRKNSPVDEKLDKYDEMNTEQLIDRLLEILEKEKK